MVAPVYADSLTALRIVGLVLAAIFVLLGIVAVIQLARRQRRDRRRLAEDEPAHRDYRPRQNYGFEHHDR